jgi:hypothetical protein
MLQDEATSDPAASMGAGAGAVVLAVLGFGYRWLARLAMATICSGSLASGRNPRATPIATRWTADVDPMPVVGLNGSSFLDLVLVLKVAEPDVDSPAGATEQGARDLGRFSSVDDEAIAIGIGHADNHIDQIADAFLH